MTRSKRPPRSTRPPLERLRTVLQEIGAEGEEGWVAADVLSRLSPQFRTLGRCLVQLCAYEDDESVGRRAGYLLLAAARDEDVEASIRHRVVQQAAPHALTALTDPDLDDEHKLAIAAFVEDAGLELPEGGLRACFRDLDGVMARHLREAAEELGDDVEALDEGLDHLLLAGGYEAVTTATIAKCGQFAFAVTAVSPGPGAALAAVCVGLALEHEAEDVTAVRAALAAAAVADPGRLLWMLEELAGWPGRDGLAGELCETVKGLRHEGVRPRSVPAPPFARAFVTSVDGAGSRGLTLLLRRDDGALDAIVFLLNDRQGVKDVWSLWEEGADIEESYQGPEITIAPCDLPFARALIQDTLHTHRASGRPFPARLLLLKAVLGSEPLVLVPREPRLGSYGLELLVPSAALADGSEALANAPPFEGLGFDSDEAFAFVAKSMRRRRRPKPESLIDGLLDAVEGTERERLTRRIAVNLEAEALAGRGRRKANRLAAGTWLVLSESLAPFAKIAYVRALALDSIPRIQECLVLGFVNQDEANDASLQGGF